jgi:DNA-binding MltR family transcriptional regulator
MQVFQDFDDALRGETDRAAAVLGAAYLDDHLEKVFRARLRSETPDTVYRYRGPLGDFASKIDLAFALGWITTELRDDLHVIREIRNKFAHDPDHLLAFEDQSIRDLTKNLRSQRYVTENIAVLLASLSVEDTPSKRQSTLAGLFDTARKRFSIGVWYATLRLKQALGGQT